MNIEELKQQIKTNDALLIYFSGENCGVCEVLKPKIQSTFKSHFPKIKQIFIQASNFPETYAHFNIFTVPSVLIYFDGKETKRESRHISISKLIESTDRTYKLFFN